jgi:phage tail protein X
MNKKISFKIFSMATCVCILLSSCNLRVTYANPAPATATIQQGQSLPSLPQTPLPTRKTYNPGELVDYTAQNGDTLSALAARFNTTVNEILEANPGIPPDATTMPPGMPMKIPIYFMALWASPYQIIPDHAFVYGPTEIGFNTAAFIESQPGWLKSYRVYAGGQWRSGAEMIDFVSINYCCLPFLSTRVRRLHRHNLRSVKICWAFIVLIGNLRTCSLSSPPTR